MGKPMRTDKPKRVKWLHGRPLSNAEDLSKRQEPYRKDTDLNGKTFIYKVVTYNHMHIHATCKLSLDSHFPWES